MRSPWSGRTCCSSAMPATRPCHGTACRWWAPICCGVAGVAPGMAWPGWRRGSIAPSPWRRRRNCSGRSCLARCGAGVRGVRARAQRDGAGGAARRYRRFDVRDPYADRRLGEFTLGIPETQYMRGGEDRWLARRVLADRLPPSVTGERRRGLQCPEWYDVVSARRDDMIAAVERIAASPLASRVVDVPRMKALLDDWPADAEAAKARKQILGHALQRGIAIGGFLRWYEGGNG